MKILQVTPFFCPQIGGIASYVLHLSQSLSQRGHQVDVLTVNTESVLKEEVIADNTKVYRCSPSFTYGNASISLELTRKLLEAKDYDVCHIHTPFPFSLEAAIAASRINHIALVATYHCEGTTRAPGIVYSMMAKLYNLYTWFSRSISLSYVSRLIFLSRSYPESLGLPTRIEQRVRVIRPGVDSQRFSPLNDGSKLRSAYSFEKSNKVVLFVGALDESHRYKGVDYLIRAVHLTRNKNSDIKLVIVGGGDLVSELKQLAEELNLGPDVKFTGSVSDEQLPLYYAMSDVFVLPSTHRAEAFGLVLFEAMASGKPCVASDIPGVRDAVKDRKTGLLVPPKEPEALAEAILRLLEDDSLRSEMAQNARKDTERHSWEKCAEEIEAIYEEVAA